MQNRFCLCGYKIIVNYSSQRGHWRPHFILQDHSKTHGKNRIAVCPNCGAPLNINNLR